MSEAAIVEDLCKELFTTLSIKLKETAPLSLVPYRISYDCSNQTLFLELSPFAGIVSIQSRKTWPAYKRPVGRMTWQELEMHAGRHVLEGIKVESRINITLKGLNCKDTLDHLERARYFTTSLRNTELWLSLEVDMRIQQVGKQFLTTLPRELHLLKTGVPS